MIKRYDIMDAVGPTAMTTAPAHAAQNGALTEDEISAIAAKYEAQDGQKLSREYEQWADEALGQLLGHARATLSASAQVDDSAIKKVFAEELDRIGLDSKWFDKNIGLELSSNAQTECEIYQAALIAMARLSQTVRELPPVEDAHKGCFCPYCNPSPDLPVPNEILSGAKLIAEWLGLLWDGLSERDISAEYQDWAFDGAGTRHMQGGKPALLKLAAKILRIRSVGVDKLRDRINSRLNDYLCEMKPDYDDSITGFNEAWDIVRKAFDEQDSTIPPGIAEGLVSRDEAAKVAENWLEIYGATKPQHVSAQDWACDAVRDIAEAIRKLPAPPSNRAAR